MVYDRKSGKRHRKFKNTMIPPTYSLVGVMICLKIKAIKREKEEKTRGGNAD